MKKRQYLTYPEVQLLFQATLDFRHCIRDRCMILMCFIHGLRVSELTGIKITDLDLHNGKVYIRRLKNGLSTTHPLHPREISLLKKWIALRPGYNKKGKDFLFLSSAGTAMTRQGFYKLLSQYGEKAGIQVQVHPHMLRHACGYELAEQGLDTRLIQDYLGHRNIRHTVHYTASNDTGFSMAWRTKINEPSPLKENKTCLLSW